MIPSPKPTKFTYELKEILDHFSREMHSESAKQHFPKLHENKAFNKRFSGVLDAFADLETMTQRLTDNIQASMSIGHVTQNKNVDQDLHKKASNVSSQNKADLRMLHVQTKVFLDRYNVLLLWVLNWNVPKICKKSIGEFNKWLKKYSDTDATILGFRECCGKELDDIYNYITKFRNHAVIHRDEDTAVKKTEWFMNDMNGSIRMTGGVHNSATPQEILFVAVNYIDCSSSFCIDHLNKQIGSQKTNP